MTGAKNARQIEIIAFISGAVLMVIEMVGIRLLAPFTGTSHFVWTSIIGVVLGSLSAGYWVGGKRADQVHTVYGELSRVLFFASIGVCVAIIGEPLALLIVTLPLDIRITSLLTCILLFTPSSFFLGMMPPLLMRSYIKDSETPGASVGKLYAISTVGSIAGTLGGGFVLLSLLGTTTIFLGASIILLFSSLALWRYISLHQRIVAVVVGFGTICFAAYVHEVFITSYANTLVADIDTNYSRWIVSDRTIPSEQPSTFRIITNNFRIGAQSVIRKDQPETLIASYLKAFDLYRTMRTEEPEKILLLGGGVYTYPLHFVASSSKGMIDVVEIDPALTQIAKEFFGFKENPRIRIINMDARVFLNSNSNVYDVILVDVFSPEGVVPAHIITKEAVSRMRESLKQGGMVITNVISARSGKNAALHQALLKTFASVFSSVTMLHNPHVPADRIQNLVLIACESSCAPPQNIDALYGKWKSDPNPPTPSHVSILTDNFAPVESYTSGFFSSFLAQLK